MQSSRDELKCPKVSVQRPLSSIGLHGSELLCQWVKLRWFTAAPWNTLVICCLLASSAPAQRTQRPSRHFSKLHVYCLARALSLHADKEREKKERNILNTKESALWPGAKMRVPWNNSRLILVQPKKRAKIPYRPRPLNAQGCARRSRRCLSAIKNNKQGHKLSAAVAKTERTKRKEATRGKAGLPRTLRKLFCNDNVVAD